MKVVMDLLYLAVMRPILHFGEPLLSSFTIPLNDILKIMISALR